MRRVILVVVLFLLLVTTGACSSQVPEPDLPTPQENLIDQPQESSAGNDPAETIALELPPIDQVEEVAGILYQGLSEGADLVSYLEAVYQALGIPVLDPETEMEQIETAIENQAPFTIESHLELIADALTSGMFINLESFITEINRQGFYDLINGGDVTLDYLSDNIAYVSDRDELSPGEIQIALVLALGTARANSYYGELKDPVWGDGLLDPLQSSLLWHLLDQVAAFPQMDHSQASVHLAALPNPQMHNLLGDLLGSLGETSAHLKEFCNTALIFGHQSQLTLSESQVYRQTPGSKKAAASEATFTLNFRYQPSLPKDKLLVAMGCPDLPGKGPRAARPVTWELIDSGARGASLEILSLWVIFKAQRIKSNCKNNVNFI